MPATADRLCAGTRLGSGSGCSVIPPRWESNAAEARLSAPASRMRSLLGDLAKAMEMQMRFWGMDARGMEGSVLVAAGLERLAREVSAGEGSSRYRQEWEGGWIEIHSYCAGFYHPTRPGILFSRSQRRVFCSKVGAVILPELHREHNAGNPPDEVLKTLPPFLRWIMHYEARVTCIARPDYRQECWRKLGGLRFGPRPEALRDWLSSLLKHPAQTPRLATLVRDAGPVPSAVGRPHRPNQQ